MLYIIFSNHMSKLADLFEMYKDKKVKEGTFSIV